MSPNHSSRIICTDCHPRWSLCLLLSDTAPDVSGHVKTVFLSSKRGGRSSWRLALNLCPVLFHLIFRLLPQSNRGGGCQPGAARGVWSGPLTCVPLL